MAIQDLISKNEAIIRETILNRVHSIADQIYKTEKARGAVVSSIGWYLSKYGDFLMKLNQRRT